MRHVLALEPVRQDPRRQSKQNNPEYLPQNKHKINYLRKILSKQLDLSAQNKITTRENNVTHAIDDGEGEEDKLGDNFDLHGDDFYGVNNR